MFGWIKNIFKKADPVAQPEPVVPASVDSPPVITPPAEEPTKAPDTVIVTAPAPKKPAAKRKRKTQKPAAKPQQ